MNDLLPTLDQINIVSSDVEASVAFYRRLGVEIPQSRIWRTASGAQHVGASRGEGVSAVGLDIDSVAFARLWNRGWQDAADLRGRVVVGFRLSSRAAVDAIYARMTGAGHRGLQPPCDAFWGARYAIIEDPDGIAVGLMSSVTDETRSAPPLV
ncbi:MAG TPA: VOC family protein [Steroidobacteraceae bacterium]|nr:VOC family protein [Steroidobacteraceae bacterium]